MSRNNIIYVAKKQDWYYVIYCDCADNNSTEFCENAIMKMTKKTSKRAKALILAHNIQKKKDTEYGVFEIDI
tara:strand:- start:250 stop:465 length:216 start_codon:yes stop_codon:yes gene_type:complete